MLRTRLSVVRPLDGGARQRIIDEWADTTVTHQRLNGDWIGETWFFVRHANEPTALPDLSRVTLAQLTSCPVVPEPPAAVVQGGCRFTGPRDSSSSGASAFGRYSLFQGGILAFSAARRRSFDAVSPSHPAFTNASALRERCPRSD